MILRAGSDADDYVALVGACWGEYPGVLLDVDGEVPELRALASHYAGKGGALWAVEDGGRLAGMIGVAPAGGGSWEIGRLYVLAGHRGSGLAQRLLGTAEAHARERGASTLHLWTDTRFERAHRFYEKAGYVRDGGPRELDDVSASVEYRYVKPLDGTLVLDAAGARSAVRRLAGILVACVDGGASVSFLPPLDVERARRFWEDAADDVEAGRRTVIAGWCAGELAGTVTLEPASSPNAPHRAEVQKLLVHPGARRRGLATRLMAAAEAEARRDGRMLLTLDTRTGDGGEQLYRALGWTEAGTIPDFAVAGDGTLGATTFFWKRV